MKRIPAAAVHAALLLPLASQAYCPVSLPGSSPVDVPHWESDGTRGWYGSEALAVLIPADGRWKGMGPSRQWGDKFWVWRRGYDATSEPVPALTFTGVRLDGGENPEHMRIDQSTSAYGAGWSSMLTGMRFPSAGCWQVTAKYVHLGIAQELVFVLDVPGE